MDKFKKCVITGLGVICAVGNNLDEVWTNIVNGKCGIKKVEQFKTDGCHSNIAAEVHNFTPTFSLQKKDIKRMDRTSLLCIEAVQEAIENSGLILKNEAKESISVVVGSCTGGAQTVDKYVRQYIQDAKKSNPLDVLKLPIHAIAKNVALYTGAEGVVMNVANACAAGTISIAMACDLIKRGEADVVIAGGADALGTLQFAGFNALDALDPLPCSPFSRSAGLTLGEGAGIIILESYEHAQNRSAHVLCEVAGYGISSDAYHITAPRPDGEGQVCAMESALESAGINASKINYINAHGTGTPLNDSVESVSLKKVFNTYREQVKISSTKSMIGHCLGAAGAIEAVLSVCALNNNVVPPTVNYDKSIEMTFDFVPNEKKQHPIDYVMSNSFAFGGNNASLILKKNSESIVENDMNKTRVFISGVGCVNPLSATVDECFKRIKNGESKAGQVLDESLKIPSIKPSMLRKLDRISRLLLSAGLQSSEDAKLEITEENSWKFGMVIGTSDGPATEISNFQEGIIKRNIHAGSAFIFPNTVYNASAGYLSMFTNIRGFTATITSGFSAGLDSVCFAYDWIKLHRNEIIMAAGADEYSHVIYNLYKCFGVTTHETAEMVKPYQFQNKLFSLSEGGASLILESENSLIKRNARPYAEVIGYGMSHKPVSLEKIDESGGSMEIAIRKACKSGNIDPDAIDGIVASANGSAIIDTMELQAYEKVFGEQLSEIPIFTVKKNIGEGRASASAMQVIFASKILQEQTAFVTRHKEQTIIINKREICLNENLKKVPQIILVTSFSFGGSCTALLLKKAR